MKLSLQLQYRYLKLRTTRNLAAQGRQSSFFHHSKIMISGLKYFFSDENMFHSYQNELPHVNDDKELVGTAVPVQYILFCTTIISS